MMGYQTGDDNRLTNDGTYSYEYDAEGNRTLCTKTSTGEKTEYQWDNRNRLVKVTDKNSSGTTIQVVEFTYDIFDRKIGKAVDTSSPFDMADAAIERYVYDDIHNSLASLDGSSVVLDFVDPDGSGTQPMALAKRYLHGEVVDQILAQEDVTKNLSAADRVLWPLTDNLGTVRDLAKQDGTIAAHYVYDAFGNVTSGDTSLTRYLFTAREFVAQVLHYVRWEGYHADAAQELKQRLDKLRGHPLGDDLIETLTEFVREQSQAARLNERLLGSTECLESLIGKGKRLEGQQSRNGFTKMVLGMAASVVKPTLHRIQPAFAAVKTKDVHTWAVEHLGQSAQAKRRLAFPLIQGTKMG